jgi:hypothetical protein
VTIRDHNKILQVPCIPPRQMPNTLKLQKLGKAVQWELGEFLRRSKKNSRDRFTSVEDIKTYLREMEMNHANFYAEYYRHVSELADNAEYQTFMKKYLTGVEMKKETEFDNFDRTMRDLMSVPHSEIKAALDAEKAAKARKKKRKAKKPSASGRAENAGD